MSIFIKSIGNCRVNNIGFDVYENKDGSATIVPEKLTKNLPKKFWVRFENLNSLNIYLDDIGLTGAILVQELKRRLL